MDNEKNKQNLDVEDLGQVSGGCREFAKDELHVEPTCNCIRLPGESGMGMCVRCKQRKGIPLSESEKMLFSQECIVLRNVDNG